jgi:hypothetical protein
MKRLLTLALCLTCAIPALAQYKVALPQLSNQQPRALALPGKSPKALTVQDLPPRGINIPSWQPLWALPTLSVPQPKITLIDDGKPVPGLPVTVDMAYYRDPHTQPRQIRIQRVSNSAGTITLPHLHGGVYSLYISSSHYLSGRIYLAVPPNIKSGRYAEFLADRHLTAAQAAKPRQSLLVGLSPGTPDGWLPRHIIRRSAFCGTVSAATLGFTPRVVIHIYRIGKSQYLRIAEIQANRQGEFSRKLLPGNYLATFETRGFQTRVLHFVLARRASSQPLKIAFKVELPTG